MSSPQAVGRTKYPKHSQNSFCFSQEQKDFKHLLTILPGDWFYPACQSPSLGSTLPVSVDQEEKHVMFQSPIINQTSMALSAGLCGAGGLSNTHRLCKSCNTCLNAPPYVPHSLCNQEVNPGETKLTQQIALSGFAVRGYQ